jgi:hypothetical protein
VGKRRDWDEIHEIYKDRPMPEGLKHGGDSWARRAYGCRCEVCMAPRKRPQGKGRPERIHGPQTRSRRIYGCTCADCVNPEKRKPLTHRERQLKLRKAKWGTPVPPGVQHGRIHPVRVYGCRCPECAEYVRVQRHKRKNPWMYRPTHGRWREENGLTTLCWPPAGAGPDWRCVCDAEREMSPV